MRAIEAHEHDLDQRLSAALAAMPGIELYSRAAVRTPTFLFTVAGHTAVEVQALLASRDINAPAGSFYALEPANRLGLGPTGAVRVGLAPYTNHADLDRLLAALPH